MTARDLFLLITATLGGLAIFILGMKIMTGGLQGATGPYLRTILARAAGNRWRGIGLGTFLGLVVGSSATTVLLVGFVNAGLMQLLQSIPAVLGANVGSSLSMQVFSLRLTDYSYVGIASGLIVTLVARSQGTKHAGEAILGFGLLFLGMETMSATIKPHRDELAPILQQIDGTTMSGTLVGVALAAGLTAIIQSSGATIAMCFSLVSAGVFTSLEQTLPIVLGAHIGTCATALLSSIGTHIEARRCAASHLLFNLVNVGIALAAAPWLLEYVPMTSADVVHQTANLHTVVMLIPALMILPLAGVFGRIVRLITPSRQPIPEPSYLDERLLERPEMALYAAIRELQRVARICARSLRLSADIILLNFDRRQLRVIEVNERTVNEIKMAMKHYLTSMTTRYLSSRQSLLIQHVNRCMTEIERIGDHIDGIRDVSFRRNLQPAALVDRESLEWLFDLLKRTEKVLSVVIESLDPDRKDFQEMASSILSARDDYMQRSIAIKADFSDKVADQTVTPAAGLFFAEYISALDRIVKHAKSIALAERQPGFWIKRKKLERVATDAPDPTLHDPVDPDDFLDRLQSEDLL